MLKLTKTVMYIGPDKFHTQDFCTYRDEYFNAPAHWCVVVELEEDNNPMSASMFQVAFACKPTRKQITDCIHKAKVKYAVELKQFKLDYPQFFRD